MTKILVMATALALAAGTLSEPATASPAQGKKHDKPAKPHKKKPKKHKKKAKPVRHTFKVSATGNWAHESRTQSYSELGRETVKTHTLFGGTWVARSKVKATRTGKNAYRADFPSVLLGGTVTGYVFEGDGTIHKAKRDYTVLPPSWDGTSFITCAYVGHGRNVAPADFTAELIGGGSPDALRVVMRTSASVVVARSGADTPDPNCGVSGWAANGTYEQAVHPEDVTTPVGVDKECKADGTWKTGWTVTCNAARDSPITFPGGGGTRGDRWSLRLEITP
jgi:hypothetical protein